MTLWRRSVLAFLALKLANLLVNLRLFPVLPAAPSGGRTAAPGGVSLLVPIRNEAHRLADTLPSLLAQRVDEVIVLDDCSDDGSSALASSLMSQATHARLVSGVPAPPGWVGKTWACQQLGKLARHDTLIFCDSDVSLRADAIEVITEQMSAVGADLFSVFPQQQTRTWGEHLTVALIDDVLLCFLPYPLLELDIPAAATANGSVLAFDRTLYERLAGFESVRGCIVEDLAMARLARRRGARLGLVLGGEVVKTRMYSSYHDVRIAFGRNFSAVAGQSRSVLLLAAVWHLAAYTAPALLLPRDRRWLLAVLAALLERLLVEHKTGRRQYWQALLMPISPIAALPIVATAMRSSHSWRGRSYS